MKKYVFALLLFLPLFTSVSVFADSQDVVYHLDSSTVESMVCKNSDPNLPNCSDYRYLKIETDFVISNVYNQSMAFGLNGGNKSVPPVNQTLDLSQMTNLTQFYVGFSLLSGTNYTATLTLTNDDACPEPEPCPSCPDCSDASRYVQIVIDAFWKFVMAFAGVVTSILVIMLVFRLIRKAF